MALNKKKTIILLSLILTFGLSNYFFNVLKVFKRKVCFRETCFYVEVADDSTERTRGLSGRKKLGQDEGMFFVFENQEKHPFWMKDMFIPLDIIWMDESGKVVYIKENAKPCDAKCCKSIMPEIGAKYTLEINSGKIKEMGLQVGDTITK